MNESIAPGNASGYSCTPKLVTSQVDLLAAAGIEAVVDYEAYSLAYLAEAQRDYLEREGARLVLIRDRSPNGPVVKVDPRLLNLLGAKSSFASQRAVLFVVEYLGPIKEDWLRELEEMGALPIQYLSGFSVLVYGPPSAIASVAQRADVWSVATFKPELKLDTSVLNSRDRVAASVCTLDPALIDRAVKESSVTVSSFLLCHWESRLFSNGDEAVLLAGDPDVLWISPLGFASGPCNSEATWLTQSAVPDRRTLYSGGITGANQVIAVADTGLRETHEMFTEPGKVVFYDTTFGDHKDNARDQGHGTHVAGTAAGDAPPFGSYNGFDGHAIGARIVVQDLETDSTWYIWQSPSQVGEMLQRAYDQGARIHSNSWGSSAPDSYTAYAQAVDDFASHHPDSVILFAACNNGPGSSTISEFANAKNAIAVGGSENGLSGNGLYWSSSRGFAGDGRLRPTLLAPAETVHSADYQGDQLYKDMVGTSMATAAVAGSVALARAYFMEGWYSSGKPRSQMGFTPTAALLRALMVNAANEVTGPGAYTHGDSYPNADQGWGRIDMDYALYFDGDRRNLFVDDHTEALAQGLEVQYHVYVVDRGEPLEASIAWTDPAAPVSCSPCLMNDLDLEVTDPYGNTYHGNRFSGHNPGQSYIGGSPEGLNTEEDVLVLSPNAGMWTVTVRNNLQSSSAQQFGLVVTGGFDSSARLSKTPADASNPAIVVDAQRNVHTVWEDSRDGTPSIYYSESDPEGNEIRAGVKISQGESHWPSIAVSPVNGELWAVWTLHRSAIDEVTVAAKSTSGGASWLYLGMVTPRPDTSERNPSILIDGQGRKHVISKAYSPFAYPYPVVEYVLEHWTDLPEPGNYDWVVAEVFSLAINNPPCQLNPIISKPQMTLGRPTYLHVSFGFAPSPGCVGWPAGAPTEIRYARSIDRGSSWTVSLVALTRDFVRETTIGARTQLDVFVAWEDWVSYDNGFDLLFARSINDGVTWGLPVDVTPWPEYQVHPAMAIELGNKLLHLAWSDRWTWMGDDYEISHMVSGDDGLSWHGQRRLTFAPGSSDRVAMAIDSFVRVHIIWHDRRDLHWEVYSQTLPRNVQITSAVPTLEPSIGNAIDASIAVHPGDNSAQVAWSEQVAGKFGVFYSEIAWDGLVRTDREPVFLSDIDEGLTPSIAVNPVTGSIWVVWSRFDTGLQRFQLQAAVRSSGTWHTVDVPSVGYASSITPSIVIDSSGRKHIVARDYEVTPNLLREAVGYRRTASDLPGAGDWDRALPIFPDDDPNPGCPANPMIYRPKIVLRGAQSVHVSWGYAPTPGCIGGGGGFTYVEHGMSPDSGQTWSSPPNQVGVTRDYARDTSIATFGNTVVIAWDDWVSTANSFDIFAARSENGGVGWQAPQDLLPLSGNQVHSTLAWDYAGQALHMFWSDDRSGDYEVYSHESTDQGRTWNGGHRLTFSVGRSDRVSAATDMNLRCRLVWHDSRSGNTEVFYANWF